MSDVYVCIHKQANTQDWGLWRDALLGNFYKLDALRLLLGPFLDKSRALVLYFFIQFLAALHAFAKPPDFKFGRIEGELTSAEGHPVNSRALDIATHIFTCGLSSQRC